MRTLGVVLAPLLLFVGTAGPALAEEAEKPRPGQILLWVLVAVVVVASSGCLLAVLRVIFPGPAAKADAAVKRLTTGRLLLTGLLPLVGAGLLGMAAQATGVEAVEVVYAIVIVIPVALLVLVGSMAAVPHLGAGLLRGGEERSLLVRSITGALVLGIGVGVIGAAVRELAPFLGLIVFGWFFGAGLGTVWGRPLS